MNLPQQNAGGEGRQIQELELLREAAAQLCQVLSQISGDESQFYQRDKNARVLPPSTPPMDIKALKDVVETLKSLTRIVRDLRELPDQPERHSQEIARAKLALAREQVKMESGVSSIALEQEVVPYAQ